jgi:hypothetical protein
MDCIYYHRHKIIQVSTITCLIPIHHWDSTTLTSNNNNHIYNICISSPYRYLFSSKFTRVCDLMLNAPTFDMARLR